MEIQPLIIAWTSENTSRPEIAAQIYDAGFNLAIESPIYNPEVQEIILPLIKSRESALEELLE